MRFLYTFLLCLFLSSAALSQTKPILEHKLDVNFADQQDRIITHKFLDTENKLLLASRKTVTFVDLINAKILEPRPIEVPEFKEDKPRLISPDGRRLIVFGNYDSKDKVKRPPSIWDLQSGKQIAVLDKTSKPIRAALWSKSGKTLATSSDKYAPFFADSTSIEVSFWDGETFEYKNSLPSGNASWWYLTEEDKCIYSASTAKLNLIIIKLINNTGPISVWDIGSGKIEQTITGRDGNIERKISAINVSPDGKFLSFVAQPSKSKESERRLVIWDIAGSNYPKHEIRPKYEIKPAPKISNNGATFSSDGKYFSFDAGKTLQIYETQTGQKRFELSNVDQPPSHWLSDDKILLYDRLTKMEALETATGRQIYQQKMIYDSYEEMHTPTYTSNGPQAPSYYTVVVDRTTTEVHPNRSMFLTYSNQYVKVLDSRTGELLQTLVSPPMDYSKKKPGISDKLLVSKAGWSEDGKTLYVIGAEGKSVSVWRFLSN